MPIEEQSIKNRDDLTIQDLRVNDLISSGDKRYIVVSPYFGNCVHVMDDDTLERREFYASEPFKLITYLGEPIICEGEWETRTGRKVSVVRNHLEHRIAFPFMYDLNDESNRRVFLAHTRHGSTPAFDIGSLRPPQASKDSREFEVGQVWKTRSRQEATIRRVLRNGYLECFLHSTNKKESLSANWLGMSTRSQDDLVEYLRESEIRYLQVGKRYRRADGEIVTIASKNPYKDNSGVEYGEFGFARAFDSSIVALVEEEPANPKQRPPFALGQVWRMADGCERTVVEYDEGDNTFCLMNNEAGDWFCPDGTMLDEGSRGAVAVEYLHETDRPRIEVGKRYRTECGKIVKIVLLGRRGSTFYSDNSEEYHHFGFHRHYGDPIVALVEDEPANPKQKEKQKGTEVVTETNKSKKNRSVGTPIHYTELQPGDLVRVKYDDKIWIEAYVDITGDDGANYINRDTDLDISDCEDEVRLLQRGALPKLRIGQQWQRADGETVVISKVNNADGHFLTECGDHYTTLFATWTAAKDLEVCLNQNTLHSDESYEVIKLNDSIILLDKNTQQEIIAPVGSKSILQTLSNFATAVCGEPTVLAPLSSIKIIEK